MLLQGPIRAVMVGYLLYRRTFMYVYILCSIASLTKTKYSIYTAYTVVG